MTSKLSRVGRQGVLKLAFRKTKDRTVLHKAFSTMPMKVFPPFYLDSTGCAYVYMVNPTAGILGGDRIEIDISLGIQSHVFLSSPAATKLLKGNGETSFQIINIALKRDAVLEYLPGYVIPFRGSNHDQKLRIQMEEGSTAIVAELFSTGRVAMGESLMFDEYKSTIEIIYEDIPIVTDRIILRPKELDYKALGVLEGCHATAVLFVVFNNPSLKKPLVNALWAALKTTKDIIGGVSALVGNGVIVRLLGTDTRIVKATMFNLLLVARRYVLAIDNTYFLSRFLN